MSHTFKHGKSRFHFSGDFSGDVELDYDDWGRAVSLPAEDLLAFLEEVLRRMGENAEPAADIGAPLFKLGPWEIWHGGESPPDVPRGGMSTGSTYYWLRWPGGPWIQSEIHPHRFLKVLSFMRPWLYDEPQRKICECGADDWTEHADDCPRGRAFRIMDGSEA